MEGTKGVLHSMITCRDCGTGFLFSESEQDFYVEKGFANEPQRCPECRTARKNQQRGGRGNSERKMFPAVCAQCGRDTMVPFRPSNDKPVIARTASSHRNDHKTGIKKQTPIPCGGGVRAYANFALCLNAPTVL